MSADRHTPMRRGVLRRAAVAAAVAGAVAAGGLAVLPGGGPGHGPAPVAADQPVVTEQQALARAKDSGKKTEVVGLRTERREIFAEPDGTFTAREYTEPVRTVQGGKWVPIDPTLVRRADGGWSPKAATVDLAFSGGQAGRPFVTMQRAGREFALTWPYGELPAPRVEGETATYVDALPGVDLTVRAETDGFGHLLVVKTPEAAADPRLAALDLGLTTDGLKVAEDATGAIVAEDAVVGGTVFEAGKPAMWDSAAVREAAAKEDGPKAVARAVKSAAASADATAAAPSPTVGPKAPAASKAPKAALEGPGGGGKVAPLGVEVGKGKLRLLPDQKLLRGKDTVFPVVIDPIQRTTSRSSWTGVMSGMPGEQDWKYSGSAGVGKCPTDYNPVSCNGVGVRRVMFTLPLSFYKGKQILGATFSARVEHIYSASPTAEPIQLYRIGGQNYSLSSSSSWSNTSDDWDDYLQTVDKAISPTSCSSQPNLNFESGATGELTSEVKTAAAGGWNSMTLGLRAADESRFAEWKRICGNAFLSVKYNNLPRQIKTSDMSTDPGGICKWGATREYAEVPPKLQAIASDPDHGNGQTDKVKVQFKVEWGGTSPGSYTYTTPDWLSPTAATRFTHTVKSTIPQNTVIYWSARAYDGDGYGPWSSDGDTAQRCEFIYDKTLPGKPNVLSKEYPSDTVYHDGVGTYGTFTFAPNPNDSIPDTDVVKYRYAFDGTATPATTLTPTKAGGSVSVQWMPARSGRHWVDVIAVDKAENPSTKAHYEFLVSEGKPVVAQWNLADEAGGTEAHDESGEFSATAGTNVTFGVDGPGGKVDKAARFDGSSASYLDASETVLDTSKSFSVSAWVRPTALDKDMTIVSQDGTGEPGFTLGYDAGAQSWKFAVPVNDVDSLGEWKAVSTGLSVVKDQWVLLTGVYDAQKTGGPQLQLYVNKDLKGSASRRSAWKSYGPLQIGRTTAKSGYRDHFTGDLAEVRVFDRVLPATQVAELMTVKPERKGYWQLDSASGGVSAETGGGQALTLAGNAAIYHNVDPVEGTAPLVGDGNLILDGDGDYASTATAPVTGNSSFTISARAQLTSLDPEKSQTVLSLPGANANRVQVRYQAATQQWELAVAKTDTAGAQVVTFTDDQELPDTGGSGQHLAVVYDAFANSIRLYVDGQLVAGAYGEDDTLWPATGGLQVGRSLRGASEYFAGAIDEVRVYSGAADQVPVQQMAGLTPLTDM
ncbi:LamG domain-containing protein [Streptomyces longwoodensis]|uniref:LamG domain-containing protein n=1 Tax=Streptomyces longwoodensis TaxID=68231 RepID=UPI002E7FC7F3|nr:LamG domain-containing protein [Streptomyces longwoodensis]WUC59875.1 LamG domain-containing protein [Streptomyces longwoodensis]